MGALSRRLGWISGVCSHDVIPRLSIRALQELRDNVIDELLHCTRSKLQLVMLLIAGMLSSCCTPLARCIQCLAGGPLQFVSVEERKHLFSEVMLKFHDMFPKLSDEDVDPLERHIVRLKEGEQRLYPILVPPGKLAQVVPLYSETVIYGCKSFHRNPSWKAQWVEPQQLTEIILTPRSLELHFPNILKTAFRSALDNLVEQSR